MKVTIDSSDSLTDVLSVLGAVYDVRLTVADKELATSTSPVDTVPVPAPEKVRTRQARKKPAAKPAASTSNEEMRSWALENGMAVSNRGRIPGRVVAAYRDEHKS